jgi:methyl-accepting chemotaxis protein
MNEFSATAEQLLASINNIAVVVDSSTNIINEAAAGVQNITERNMTTVERIQQVKDSTIRNEESVEKLKELISKFKL